MDFERCMDEYAKLIVCGGIRVDPGEKVLINSDITTSDMAHRVSKVCYEQGAAKVEIRWSDSKMTAMTLMKGIPCWRRSRRSLQEIVCR